MCKILRKSTARMKGEEKKRLRSSFFLAKINKPTGCWCFFEHCSIPVRQLAAQQCQMANRSTAPWKQLESIYLHNV